MARAGSANEDGDPYLYGRCHLVDVALDDAPGYLGFYPGSLPGHTFGANRAGLVQTINNLRAPTARRRAAHARAALDCATLEEAVQLLRATPCAGGFHHTLGSAQDARLFSVEVLPGDVSIQEIGARYGHANHMIHADTAGLPQVVTDSSRARQHRIEGIVDSWSPATGGAELLAALHDTEGALPILRTDRHDPDGENTLATAVFEIGDGEVTLRVYDQAARGDRAGRDERSGSATRGKPDASRERRRAAQRPARRSRRLPAFPPRTHRPDAAGRCPRTQRLHRAVGPLDIVAAHGAGLAARQAERRVQAVVRQDRGRHVFQEAHAAHAAVAAG